VNILIADDETPARQRLRQLLVELAGDIQVVGEAANGEEVLARCRELAVDLVLLDIRMPGMDGLEAAARLAELDPPPAVIFITAYDEHAVAAFERQARDYLLKPVRRERLDVALRRVTRLSRPQLPTLERLSRATPERRQHLTAIFRGVLHKVPVADICYLQANQKYVTAHYPGGDLLLEESLKSLEDEFGERFLRIHRNALIARDRLVALEKDPAGQFWVRLRDCEERLEVSRRHLPDVRRWLRIGV
jgi:two-component system, LytTR family, response regulator AlgR